MVPGAGLKCLMGGMVCFPIYGVMEGPYATMIRMAGEEILMYLALMPIDLVFQAWPGNFCDCLCPIQSNERLGALDCGTLASTLASEKSLADKLNAAQMAVGDAAGRLGMMKGLTKMASKLGGLPMIFPPF